MAQASIFTWQSRMGRDSPYPVSRNTSYPDGPAFLPVSFQPDRDSLYPVSPTQYPGWARIHLTRNTDSLSRVDRHPIPVPCSRNGPSGLPSVRVQQAGIRPTRRPSSRHLPTGRRLPPGRRLYPGRAGISSPVAQPIRSPLTGIAPRHASEAGVPSQLQAGSPHSPTKMHASLGGRNGTFPGQVSYDPGIDRLPRSLPSQEPDHCVGRHLLEAPPGSIVFGQVYPASQTSSSR